MKNELLQLIGEALNKTSAENISNSPDFILANYLMKCLEAFDLATQQRDEWYNVHLSPANKFFLEQGFTNCPAQPEPKG